jgi:hypothetical protein
VKHEVQRGNRSCSPFHSLDTDCIDNTSPNSSSIVASRREHSFPVTPLLRVTLLLQPLPNNGCFIAAYFEVVA